MGLFDIAERSDLARRAGVSDQAIALIEEAASRKYAGVNPLDGVQPNAREVSKLLVQKGSTIYREAADQRMSLSRYMETIDPSHRYDDGLDAYDRQLKLFNIIPRSIPEKGIYADSVKRMVDGGTGVPLGSEIYNPQGQRFYMSDQPASLVLFPEFINRQLRVTGQILPSILGDLVAITTAIDSAVYDTFYLNLDATQLSLNRVTEGASMATAEMTGAQHQVRLFKYGRRLLGSYEVFRRMSLDRFSFHLQQMAIEASVDKSQRALDIIINGDGNGNAAVNYNLTAMQGGSAGDPLTLSGWLSFLLKWKDPYKITTIIAQDAQLIKLLLLNMGTFNIPYMQFRQMQPGMGGGFEVSEPFNMGGGIRLYSRAFAPANTLVAIDNTRCLEMLTEIGADIVETDKMIGKQLNEIVVSEVVGYAILDPLANKTLTMNA